ncbi:hypothetical protein LAG90_16035 [Marinilongibacter aquaticus]|uniref:hypothetical protein n=1 Tax=Marinilongibacter aquaticus TaxID=2975157 RepID=UPI0021BD1119|nr:hypothetical protein [Marinilongibacter aquaticus]UBM58313.1 hypothetical protein LAG90_16035 [Marinilongibacter aquaticus]
MVKKSIFIAAALLLAYMLFLRLLPKDLDTNQSIWGDNVIKAQDYLYCDEQVEQVIVGTSLSSRLFTDSLGPNSKNLAFSGSTLWDGLELIKARKQKPKRVWVETTFQFKQSDYVLTDYVLSIPSRRVKEMWPALREANQPVGVAKAMLVDALRGPSGSLPVDSIAVEIMPEILKIQAEYFEKDYSEYFVQQLDAQLEMELQQLIDQNIEVVLFEMPLYPDFCTSDVVQNQRKEYFKLAQKKGVWFVPMDNCAAYQTNDGIHMVRHSALKFTKYLLNFAQESLIPQ